MKTRSVKNQVKGKGPSSTPPDSTAVDDTSLEPFLRMLSTAGSDQSSLISADLVQKVNKGALGEILAFLAAHMRGREEVKKARTMIVEAGVGVNPGLVELEKLERGVKSARMAVEVARREREGKRARLDVLEKDKATLEGRERRERELGTLLGALEVREGVRIKRIEEVEKMVNQLRKEVEGVRKDGKLGPPCPQVTPIELTPPKWRPRHTKETIAKLHACHIRLKADCLTPAQIHAAKEAEERLEDTIRSSIQRNLTESEMREILDTCKQTAQERATRRWVGYTSSTGDSVDWEYLESKAHQIRNKETQVKTLNEAIIAKMALVEKYWQVVGAFRERTVDTIKKTLREEEEETKGYVEIMKNALTQGCVVKEEETITRNESDQLGRELRRCYEMEGFLNELARFKRAERGAEIIAKYKKDTGDTEERISRLLERKTGKGRLGIGVVEEIEVLCAEARELSG